MYDATKYILIYIQCDAQQPGCQNCKKLQLLCDDFETEDHSVFINLDQDSISHPKKPMLDNARRTRLTLQNTHLSRIKSRDFIVCNANAVQVSSIMQRRISESLSANSLLDHGDLRLKEHV